MYQVVNGQFVWAGPGPEPTVGETRPAYEARAAVTPTPISTIPGVGRVLFNGQGVLPPGGFNGVALTPAALQPTQVQPGSEIGIWGPLLAGGLGWLFGWLFGDEGNGNGLPPLLGPGNGVVNGAGPKGEAFRDWGGIGKHGREGVIHPDRTTHGTGWIDAETFRAWDPILQRYYQLENGSEYSDISFAPGKMAPGGNMIVKAWVTHAWRKDNSLASTQFARLANGRMMSLSETGIIKSWRPVKNIVMARGKTTLSQAVTAQRYLDKLWRKVARKTKQLKLA